MYRQSKPAFFFLRQPSIRRKRSFCFPFVKALSSRRSGYDASPSQVACTGRRCSRVFGLVAWRVGAGGNIGMETVLASPPDGYTIGFVTPNNAINATLYEHLPFDFLHDYTPVAGTMKLANVMDVNLSFPAKDLAEFIAMAKADPGKINFASGGVGTS